MPLREITPPLFTGGPDAISDYWNLCQPLFILRLDKSINLDRVRHVACVTVDIPNGPEGPGEEDLRACLAAALPHLRAGEKVLVLCSEEIQEIIFHF